MVKIRLFQEQDAQQVSALIGHTMMTSNIKDYPLHILYGLRDYFTPGKVVILASERHFLVAEDGNSIIGTGAIEDGEIKTVFIHPDYQGKGIGQQIMERLEAFAKRSGIAVIKLSASVSGVPFYRKLGYIKGETYFSETGGTLTLMEKGL